MFFNFRTLSLFSSVKIKFLAISIRFHFSASLNWDWRYSCLATTLFSFLRRACKIATSISATPFNGRHTVNRFRFLMSNTEDSKLVIIKSILNCSLKYFSIFALISSRNCLSFTKLKRGKVMIIRVEKCCLLWLLTCLYQSPAFLCFVRSFSRCAWERTRRYQRLLRTSLRIHMVCL